MRKLIFQMMLNNELSNDAGHKILDTYYGRK